MYDLVEVSTQAELDRAVKNGDVAVCRKGFFTAYDSASVRAYDSASVRASGSASVRATPFVPVQSTGTRTRVSGGVLIEIPDLTVKDNWIAYYGLEVEDGKVVVYKAVDDDLESRSDRACRSRSGRRVRERVAFQSAAAHGEDPSRAPKPRRGVRGSCDALPGVPGRHQVARPPGRQDGETAASS